LNKVKANNDAMGVKTKAAVPTNAPAAKTEEAQKQETVVVNKMYGVIYACPITSPFSLTIPLKPSIGMLREIEALPSGTRVGIETLSPKDCTECDAALSKMGLHWDPGERKYWGRVRTIIDMFGLVPVYLDTPAQYAEHVRFGRARYRLMTMRTKSRSTEQARKLDAKIYRTDVESMFYFAFRRHAALIERIIAERPQVVILAIGHGDAIWTDQQEKKLKGFGVKDYSQEDLPDLSEMRQRLEVALISQPRMTEDEFSLHLAEALGENRFVAYPEGVLDSARESARRRHRAITEGRVTDGTPSYIGTWSMGMPAKGVFEMFIGAREPDGDGGEYIRGIIEDTLGTAAFSGHLSGTLVSFSKRYDKLAVEQGGARARIIYQGTRKEKKVEGEFMMEGSGRAHAFEMQEFEPNKSLYAMKRT